MISDLDRMGVAIDFDIFLDSNMDKFVDRNTKNGINIIFGLLDDDKTRTINLNNLRKVEKELGESMTVDELNELLERVASNGHGITSEDFYNAITKRAFS